MAVPVDVLKKCQLFSGFTDTGLTIIAGMAKLRDLPKGMSLFLQGAAGDSLFIVDSGVIEIFVGQGASTKSLALLTDGDHFGELSLIRAGTRAVSARAKAPTKLVEIRRSDFNETLKTKPQACVKLMLSIFSAIEKRLMAVKDDILRLI